MCPGGEATEDGEAVRLLPSGASFEGFVSGGEKGYMWFIFSYLLVLGVQRCMGAHTHIHSHTHIKF